MPKYEKWITFGEKIGGGGQGEVFRAANVYEFMEMDSSPQVTKLRYSINHNHGGSVHHPPQYELVFNHARLLIDAIDAFKGFTKAIKVLHRSALLSKTGLNEAVSATVPL